MGRSCTANRGSIRMYNTDGVVVAMAAAVAVFGWGGVNGSKWESRTRSEHALDTTMRTSARTIVLHGGGGVHVS
eukprot:SAG11_NODE_1225_length_5476_cov_7.465129_3_plen_74_part_00